MVLTSKDGTSYCKAYIIIYKLCIKESILTMYNDNGMNNTVYSSNRYDMYDRRFDPDGSLTVE